MKKTATSIGLAVLMFAMLPVRISAQDPQEMQHQHHMGQISTVKPEFPRLKKSQENPSGPVYRLDELEQMALANNPTLTQATTQVRASNALRRQVGLYPNPTVGYLGEEVRGGSFGGGEQGFFISQAFVTGGKLGLNRKIVGHEVKIAEFETEEQRYRVLNAVRLAYYRVLAAQEMLDAKRDLVRIAAETVKTAQQLRNLGQADETEVLHAEVEEQQLRMAVLMQENSLQQSWRALASVVGDPRLSMGTVLGDLEQDLPVLDEQLVVEGLVSESPAVRIAQASVDRARAVLARERRETIPDIHLRAGLQQNNQRLEGVGRAVGLQGFVEVGVQLYIFNRNQGNIEAAKANVERAQAEARRVQLVLRERGSTFFQMYRNSRIMVDQYRNELFPRARQAYEIMVTRYGRMLASYPQVIMTQRTLFQLQTDYISALEDLWMNSIALRGYLLTDGLEAPARPGEIDLPVREINIPTPQRTTMMSREP